MAATADDGDLRDLGREAVELFELIEDARVVCRRFKVDGSSLYFRKRAGRQNRPIVAGSRGDYVPPATPGPGDGTTCAIVPGFCAGANDLDQVLGFCWEKRGARHGTGFRTLY